MTPEAFVTDTHPLIWVAAGQRRKLSRHALRAFEAVDSGKADVYVPTAVVLETWLLAQSGALKFEPSLEKWWARLRRPTVHLLEMEPQLVFDAAALNWAHRDIYDRLVVATALHLGLPLVTADREITRFGGVEIVW